MENLIKWVSVDFCLWIEEYIFVFSLDVAPYTNRQGSWL